MPVNTKEIAMKIASKLSFNSEAIRGNLSGFNKLAGSALKDSFTSKDLKSIIMKIIIDTIKENILQPDNVEQIIKKKFVDFIK